VYAALSQNAGQIDASLNHREAPGSLHSSVLLSGSTCRCVFRVIPISVCSMSLCLANKAALGRGSDINLSFRPEDNQRLIVHEYAGLEPGDVNGLRTVRDFITNRTDPNRAPAERLHAIW
jgi:hypothetical protein